MLEASLGTAGVPTLTALAERGTLGRATTTFPSLTPVCLSSIATGAHPDVHEIPHLVWWHRGERRLVEYGSSFGAARAAGLGRTLRDTLVGMNAEHLGRGAVTMFEALADAGLRTAAVNFTAYRGRTRHGPPSRSSDAVLGPERFYFYNLFRSERTGAPLSFRNRAAGSIDAYAAAVGRWLVTRDGFDFLLLYLSDYDYASHAAGPDAAHVRARALRRRRSAGSFAPRAGWTSSSSATPSIVMSDHGQTSVSRGRAARRPVPARARDARRGLEPRRARLPARRGRAVGARRSRSGSTASRRSRSPCSPRTGRVVARRDGAELRLGSGTGSSSTATRRSSTIPTRSSARPPRSDARTPGEVVVSATEGWEFEDLGRRHHLGGGSHGSLVAGDSLVPVLTHGLAGPAPTGIVDVAPRVLAHFGVAAPAYAMRRAA